MYRDDVAFARGLARGAAAARSEFDERYRPVVRAALEQARARWRPQTGVDPWLWVALCVDALHARRAFRGFRGEVPFGAWLFAMAMGWFQRRFELVLTPRAEARVLHAFPGASRSDEDIRARLRRAVHALCPLDRFYARLFFVEALPCDIIADRLGERAVVVETRRLRLLDRIARLAGVVTATPRWVNSQIDCRVSGPVNAFGACADEV